MTSSKNAGELTAEHLLPRVRLRAFSTVAGAVVADGPPLLQFTYEQATAMAAVHQPGVGEIVLHFASAIRRPRVEQLLDTLPSFAAHQGFVRALVCGTVPVEIATVKTLSKNMVDIAAIQLTTAQRNTLAVQFLDERFDGMTPRYEAVEELRDHRRRMGIGYDRALAVRTVRVLVADWSGARIDYSARLFRHSLDRFLAQIEAVVARHQNFDPVDEVLIRLGVGAEDFTLLDQMNGDAPSFTSSVA
jgi:hypothetical protein